jgi:hypothetical protein
MKPGAQTPEELSTLLEDAFVIRDRGAVELLFEDGAVLGADRAEAHGGDQIGRFAMRLWESEQTYLADPRHVVQARDTALVLGGRSIHVAHRAADRRWRYAISLLEIKSTKGDT